ATENNTINAKKGGGGYTHVVTFLHAVVTRPLTSHPYQLTCCFWTLVELYACFSCLEKTRRKKGDRLKWDVVETIFPERVLINDKSSPKKLRLGNRSAP
ncbi:unnamed protein product, partial [Sphacelaria rigidula]